ncbi:GntR family transcriptional regulator [Streptomyces sp. NPDC001508]|uniref:GntR family transcriptional regulator n=1 Tax=Streptomyces sp. NPDC001508 TaxID=3154656 RepID=UPI003331706F
MQLKDRVYEYLRRAIINGDFEVGAALREIDISKSLGVSKTPVREAFVRLQKDRFVELFPYRGAIVAGYSRRDLRELYEVRELVEGRCAARAASSRNDDLCEALQRNVRDSRAAIDNGKVEDVIALFEHFDRLIYSQSDNKWINDIIYDLEGHQRRIGRLTVDIPGRIEHSLSEHEKICTAIVRQDPAAAEKYMRAHVMSVMSDQLESFVGNETKR